MNDVENDTLHDLASYADEIVDRHWDADITVAEWWDVLFEAGLSDVSAPRGLGGLGRAHTDNQLVLAAFARRGVLGPPPGIGTMLAVPTLLTHGSAALIERFVPDTLRGRLAWCQLFSEPGAGSDLAGLQTVVAERSDGGFAASGQKVWTSGATRADWGLLVARTDTSAPKHAGISYFVVEMDQPAIDVRPLREMTGRSLFCEVFLTEAQIEEQCLVGTLGEGWTVARTTLYTERQVLGARYSAGSLGNASPGSASADLDVPAVHFVIADAEQSLSERAIERLAELLPTAPASRVGAAVDAIILQRINEWIGSRARNGQLDAALSGSLMKLNSSQQFRHLRQAVGDHFGAAATAADPSSEHTDLLAQEVILWSPAPSIYGGTDQIQRNILSERFLGLPRDRSA